MSQEELQAKVKNLNQHVATIIMARIAQLFGIPAILFIGWTFAQDMRAIQKMQLDLHSRMIIVEYMLNIAPTRQEQWDTLRKKLGERSS